MEKAALQKIMEAEKKADEIITVGIKESRVISEKSASEVKRLKIEFEDLLDRETNEIINKRIKEAEAEATELEASFISECNDIKNKAADNIKKAVAFVVEKVGSGKWQ